MNTFRFVAGIKMHVDEGTFPSVSFIGGFKPDGPDGPCLVVVLVRDFFCNLRRTSINSENRVAANGLREG